MYIDDYLLVHSFPKELQVLVTGAVNTLENIGLPINFKKSLLIPGTTVEYIGWNLDFVKKEISLPPRKQQELKNWVARFHKNNFFVESFKEWQSFVGTYVAFRTRKEDIDIEHLYTEISKEMRQGKVRVDLSEERVLLSFIRLIISSRRVRNLFPC